MKEFDYTVQDALGIHARPAGQIAKYAKENRDRASIKVEKVGGKSADAVRVMALMTLGVSRGDRVTVTLEGGDEEVALRTVEQFFQEHL